jgi:hypothetical protein
MTTGQIFCLIILFVIANIRPLFYRHSAIHSHPTTTISIVSIWSLFGLILLYPFYGHMFFEAIPILMDKPYLIFLGLSKGCVLWCLGYIGQHLRRQSSSSCAYAKQISIAGVAIINSFQGEVLHLPQWSAVIALAILGIVFGYKGHISSLSKEYKIIFMAMVVLCIVPASVDHAVISQTNWYTLMVLMVAAKIAITFFKLDGVEDVKQLFVGNSKVALGVMMLVTEIAIMMILVTHVPVTMAILTMSLSVPTMMVVSSLLWKEGHWKQQATFGALGYAAMLPMVLL